METASQSVCLVVIVLIDYQAAIVYHYYRGRHSIQAPTPTLHRKKTKNLNQMSNTTILMTALGPANLTKSKSYVNVLFTVE